MSFFDLPVIDGVSPSFADIAVRVSPVGGLVGGVLSALGGKLLELGDIAAVNTGVTVELGEQREGGRVIKRTRGSVSYEASLTLYSEGYDKLIRGLLATAPSRGNQALISLVTFSVNVVWSPPGTTKIFEKRLKGCRIIGDKEDSAEGTDAAQIEVALHQLEIVRVIDGREVAML